MTLSAAERQAMNAAVTAKVLAMTEAERETRSIELRDRDTPLTYEERTEFVKLYFGDDFTVEE
jgi:hypothetical protein